MWDLEEVDPLLESDVITIQSFLASTLRFAEDGGMASRRLPKIEQVVGSKVVSASKIS